MLNMEKDPGFTRMGMRINLMLLLLMIAGHLIGQYAMMNPLSRNHVSLNGNWSVIIDPTGIGEWRQVWLEHKPQKKTDFFEYAFEGGPELKVPGDFNSQLCELTYYEGTVWYKKQFNCIAEKGQRLFLYFGAVNYRTDVYLNGLKIGSHEGGFTPFQFEITGKVKNGVNNLIVRVNNRRMENGLPGTGYDWLNYGGITREVSLIKTTDTYISDYSIQLKKGSIDTVLGWIQLDGIRKEQKITVHIPDLRFTGQFHTDKSGFARMEFNPGPELWSPENPRLYSIQIIGETDTIEDLIGFRCIEVKGNTVLLNKKPVFLKGVNIHEENPFKGTRAFSTEDAQVLLHAARELGCNLLRLAHYPYNENMIREAEKMGFLIWEELPVYQHIQFSDSLVPVKMETMMHEMIHRDRNRCGIIIWSLSNETYPSTAGRNEALIALTRKCRESDSTRLITHVMNSQEYSNHTFFVRDPLYDFSDLVSINEYIGWYVPWQGKPSDTKWEINCNEKPVFISEFGGEALFGSAKGPTDEAAYWTEEYQENIFKNQTEMFQTIPNLAGVCPWLLYDYRSPGRMHPVYQKGYNRKGLLSEKGEKKKAWYIMQEYYKK